MAPIVGNSTILLVEDGHMSSLQATFYNIFRGFNLINDDGLQGFSSVAVRALNDILVSSHDDIVTLQTFLDDIAVGTSNRYEPSTQKTSEAVSNAVSESIRTGTGSVAIEENIWILETYVSSIGSG